MRRIKYLLLILIIPSTMKADVIYSPYSDFDLAGSIEFIGSYEYTLSKSNTIDLWGGIGIVSRSFEGFNPSFGSEIALEARQYFKKDQFQGLNLGLYMGFAYMRHYSISHAHIRHDNNSIGLVPGLKLTYKIVNNSKIIYEPYIGLSNPFHNEINNSTSYENLGYVFTIGIRIGFGKVKTKN